MGINPAAKKAINGLKQEARRMISDRMKSRMAKKSSRDADIDPESDPDSNLVPEHEENEAMEETTEDGFNDEYPHGEDEDMDDDDEGLPPEIHVSVSRTSAPIKGIEDFKRKKRKG